MQQTLQEKVEQAVDQNAPENVHPSEWDLAEILTEIELVFPIKSKIAVEELEKLDRDGMKAKLFERAVEAYEAKEEELTPEIMRTIESQYIMLPVIDRLWVDHLYVMDALKTGIGLRQIGQKDPRVEYEKEAYEIFEDLKNNIADEAIKSVFRVVVERTDNAPPGGEAGPLGGPAAALGNGATHNFEPIPDGSLAPPVPEQAPRLDPAYAQKLLGPVPGSEQKRELHTNRDEAEPAKPRKTDAKVGRNEACPCGSGKKYKRCHGVTA
jgi:preprotein translocase subunit SecA